MNKQKFTWFRCRTNLVTKNPQILWQLYEPFNVSWQLTGDKQQTAQVNKNIVELNMNDEMTSEDDDDDDVEVKLDKETQIVVEPKVELASNSLSNGSIKLKLKIVKTIETNDDDKKTNNDI